MASGSRSSRSRGLSPPVGRAVLFCPHLGEPVKGHNLHRVLEKQSHQEELNLLFIGGWGQGYIRKRAVNLPWLLYNLPKTG